MATYTDYTETADIQAGDTIITVRSWVSKNDGREWYALDSRKVYGMDERGRLIVGHDDGDHRPASGRMNNRSPRTVRLNRKSSQIMGTSKGVTVSSIIVRSN